MHVLRYRPWMEARTLPGFLVEYAIALRRHDLARLAGERTARIDVVQACNPPDLLFLVALPLVLFRGARFVFDHHDASPELLVAKGSAPGSRVVRAGAGARAADLRVRGGVHRDERELSADRRSSGVGWRPRTPSSSAPAPRGDSTPCRRTRR